MKRTKLADRKLPDYTKAEEYCNSLTHAAGAVFGIFALVLCIVLSAKNHNVYGVISSSVYGVSMIALFSISSIYHGLKPGMGKKVMQIIDHCTIYFLIAGTYTVIVLSAVRPVYPVIGWSVFCFEWLMAAIAATLTAIDLKAYNTFSMICYIGMGWAICPFIPQTIEVLGTNGFILLLSGGIAYTIGAVLYGIGSKVRWMHSIFHIFVNFGCFLQFISVALYAL